MSYFRELPNVEYQSFLSSAKASDDYILIKNLFRRVKLREDLQNVFTIFNKYEIQDGARPELVAYEFYGSEEYDWVVIMSAGIVHIRDEWPLSDNTLYDYALEVYGNELNDVHHYETTEVKDDMGRLILPEGKVVDSDFTIPNPANKLATLNPVIGISNYDYEVRKNNEKRSIYLLKPEYLQQVVNDIKKEMTYDRSSQYVNNRTIKTENTKIVNSKTFF
tara:strand:- start:246 stop:905 length:660 start_codon:yes stop_codon:yes gene_type:complete